MSDYGQWRNWETAQVAYIYEEYKDYRQAIEVVLDDCECEGLSEDEAVNRVADEIWATLRTEFDDARNCASDAVNALILDTNDLDIDYGMLAEHFVGMIGYHPQQSSENRKPRKAAAKSSQSNNRKPRKAPAKKPAQRRR